MNDYWVVGFEVLKAVVMKSNIFWIITQCSLLTVNRLFWWTYQLHLQGRISRTRYQRERRRLAVRCLSPAFTLLSCSSYYTLKMEAVCSSETSALYPRKQYSWLLNYLITLVHLLRLERIESGRKVIVYGYVHDALLQRRGRVQETSVRKAVTGLCLDLGISFD
jgi:hypothetical protein